MSERYFSITFPKELIKEPVLYSLVRRYGLVTNVYRAAVSSSSSWMIFSLSGEENIIDQAALDLKCRGAIVTEGGRELLNTKEPPKVSGVRIRVVIPQEKVEEPLFSDLVTNNDVVVDIRTARINEDGGVIVMELTGALAAIDAAIESYRLQGVRVEPVEGNVIE